MANYYEIIDLINWVIQIFDTANNCCCWNGPISSDFDQISFQLIQGAEIIDGNWIKFQSYWLSYYIIWNVD